MCATYIRVYFQIQWTNYMIYIYSCINKTHKNLRKIKFLQKERPLRSHMHMCAWSWFWPGNNTIFFPVVCSREIVASTKMNSRLPPLYIQLKAIFLWWIHSYTAIYISLATYSVLTTFYQPNIYSVSMISVYTLRYACIDVANSTPYIVQLM